MSGRGRQQQSRNSSRSRSSSNLYVERDVCGGCRKEITHGKFIIVEQLYRKFHIGCFRCQLCKSEIVGEFYNRNGKAECVKCPKPKRRKPKGTKANVSQKRGERKNRNIQKEDMTTQEEQETGMGEVVGEEECKDPSLIFRLGNVSIVPKEPSVYATLPKTFSGSDIPTYHENIAEPEDSDESASSVHSNEQDDRSFPFYERNSEAMKDTDIPQFHNNMQPPPELPPHLRSPPPKRSQSLGQINLPPRPGQQPSEGNSNTTTPTQTPAVPQKPETKSKSMKDLHRSRSRSDAKKSGNSTVFVSPATRPRIKTEVQISKDGKAKTGPKKKKKGIDPLKPQVSNCGWTLEGKPRDWVKPKPIPKLPEVHDRLTDTEKYTGIHRSRFDEKGQGRGIDGRDDEALKGAWHPEPWSIPKYKKGKKIQDLSQITRQPDFVLPQGNSADKQGAEKRRTVPKGPKLRTGTRGSRRARPSEVEE